MGPKSAHALALLRSAPDPKFGHPRSKLMRQNPEAPQKIDLGKMTRWLGPPPLLGGKKPKDFANYVGILAECMEPDDQAIATPVYQYAIETYMHMRLTRYQARVIHRRNKARANFDTMHAHNQKKPRS